MSKIGRSYEDIWNERDLRIDKKSIKSIKMYKDEGNKRNKINKTVLRGIFECNNLSDLFFSQENIKNIQNQIRYNVWKESNHVYIVHEQDPMELSIIMRSLYLQYSKNMDKDIKVQIKRLNNIVVEDVTPTIMSNIQQYLTYLRDKQKPYRTMDRPINVSSAGLKSLRVDKALGFN